MSPTVSPAMVVVDGRMLPTGVEEELPGATGLAAARSVAAREETLFARPPTGEGNYIA